MAKSFLERFHPLERTVRSERDHRHRQLRALRAFALVLLVLIGGTLGFYYLTDEDTNLLTCLYMTVITVSTVGFNEAVPVNEHEDLMVFTILVSLFGVGTVLYFFTTLTSMVVENDLRHRLWRRRMHKVIANLEKHTIVVGAGRCGREAIRELHEAGIPLVVVEQNVEHIDGLSIELSYEVPHVIGDALEDTTLVAAGIHRASGLIATLHEDRDNLFLSLSAKQLNPKLKVVAKADDRASFGKFKRVGVNAIVSPPVMGGRHLVSELIRPEVATFVDRLLSVTESAPALVEVDVGADSSLVGQTLGQADLRSKVNCLIVGLKGPDDAFFLYNPGIDQVFTENMRVIALGDLVALERLRSLMGSQRAETATS